MRLVLIHGTRSSAEQWEGYSQLLAEHEVRAIDLPGHGSRQAETFSWTAALDAIDDACGSDGADVVLVGHSLGGYLCTAYAAERPRRLGGLALLGATADPRGPVAAPYRLLGRLLGLAGPDRLRSFAAVPAAWRGVLTRCSPDQLRQVECPVLLMNGQFDQMRLNVDRYASAARHPVVGTVPRASHLFPVTHREFTAAELARWVQTL